MKEWNKLIKKLYTHKYSTLLFIVFCILQGLLIISIFQDNSIGDSLYKSQLKTTTKEENNSYGQNNTNIAQLPISPDIIPITPSATIPIPPTPTNVDIPPTNTDVPINKIDNSKATATSKSTTPAKTIPINTTNLGVNTLNTSLFLDTDNQLNIYIKNLSNSDPNKAILNKVAANPQARWFGDWNTNIKADVSSAVTRAKQVNKIPVLIAYNIPFRDCFLYSSGGASSANSYKAWIDGFAQGLGDNPAMIVIEPDASADNSCLSQALFDERLGLINYAVKTLSKANTSVYIDAGNVSWIPAAEMAKRLKSAGIDSAKGFALNISNFETNDDNIAYADSINKSLGQSKSYIIDTSRNGKGKSKTGDWCNPLDVALGSTPQLRPISNIPLLDGFLWLKAPGESDGTCNGGPSAGTWWPEYILALANNSNY